MKSKSLLYFLLFSTFIFAQERYFLKSDTRLYTTNSTSSSFLGYFKYGAEIQLLSANENGWYKVKSDNLSEGFVPSKFVSKTLNVSDLKTKDTENPIIEGGDEYYGGNHLFVLGAGLKARALPDKTSKLREILTCGEPVAVNYLPLNSEEWVNISGSFNVEYAKYVQRKYLGNRPNFEELSNQFDKLNASNIAERKTVAERLVELAWNSENEKLIVAYDKYYSVVKQLNDEKLLADSEVNMLLAKSLSKHKSDESIIDFTKNAEFVVKGIKSKNYQIAYKDLIKAFGKPTKTEKISDECGVFLSDIFYYYKDLQVSVDVKQNIAELIKVLINSNNKFVINANSILNNTTTEKEFITKYNSYIDAHFKTPHIYYLMIDAGSITIEFKDGKIYSVTIGFDC